MKKQEYQIVKCSDSKYYLLFNYNDNKKNTLEYIDEIFDKYKTNYSKVILDYQFILLDFIDLDDKIIGIYDNSNINIVDYCMVVMTHKNIYKIDVWLFDIYWCVKLDNKIKIDKYIICIS